VTASNVLGLVRGTGAEGRGVFVVGAHQDHVGYGGASSLAPGVHAVHNGADDNASGTAVVLELARRVARAPLRRDVVFALFAAEELGLVGSRWLVQHRPAPLRDIAAVMNLDMVGRLRDCRLFVEARETAALFAPAVEAANAPFGFDARPWEPTRGAWGASDHMSFIEARVPGVFLFTGLHDEYHRPPDDPPTVNHRGLGAVADFAEAILRRVDEGAARDPDALRFNAR
jgi:Zn-dependent M28 family amino/carboxypeptidase